VYAVPVVNPLTVMGELEPVPVKLPGEEIAVYPVIALPPSDAGAVNATVAVVGPVAVAVPIVGAPGTEATNTELLAALDGPVPPGVEAATVNEYVVPLVRPLTVIGEAPVPVTPPGLDVAV
jgi:hypothetical protein